MSLAEPDTSAPITTADLVRVFGRIGLLSFGGPAAQIALMHKSLVEERTWLNEPQFLRALSFCMLLPGPEAMQLATYAGWKLRGTLGGLIAGGLFVVPGAFVIAVLALLYSQLGQLDWVQGMFMGIQACVVVIIVQALIRVSGKALQGVLSFVVSLGAFCALFAFQIPFPMVIFIAAVVGALFLRGEAIITVPLRVDLANLGGVVVLGGALWSGPILLLWAMEAEFLLTVATFFSTLAVVTFGGAYAVLAYMTQTVVADLGWLTTSQMMDALGLAETTPGPLILVTQFVAMIAGQFQGGVWLALAAGALTLWVTFVPCFIWIFAGAPLIDWLEGQARLQGALSGVTTAVVGVIANLSLWFALHVFFAEVQNVQSGWMTVPLPEPTSIRPELLILALLAAALLLWRKFSVVATLSICAGAGWIVAAMTDAPYI